MNTGNKESQKAKRLLLIEMASIDRFHRAIIFPYLAGFAGEFGLVWIWLRIGIMSSRQFETGKYGNSPEDKELAEVVSKIKNFDPTHIALDRNPSASFVEKLQKAAPHASFGLVEGNADHFPGLKIIGSDVERWNLWLEVSCNMNRADPEQGSMPGSVRKARRFYEITPDFGFTAINEAAEKMQPLPFLVSGAECTFFRPLKKNPVFEKIDLSSCNHPGGCSFCAGGSVEKQVQFSKERFRKHLDALIRTLPPYSGRIAIRLQGELPLKHIREIAGICRKIQLENVDLLFDARSDELNRQRKKIEEACGLLKGTGSVLHTALIGIENFSDESLLRFNKGLSSNDNLDAIFTLLALEKKFPDSFGFKKYGGLSLILFDPWTSPEELALNLRIIRECGLEPFCGKFPGGKLRLEPGMPITALAEKEGLIIERFSDPVFCTAMQNMYGEEIAWRFKDPRMESICSIILRLCDSIKSNPDDPLSSAIKNLIETGNSAGKSRSDIAIEMIDMLIHSDVIDNENIEGFTGEFLKKLESSKKTFKKTRFKAKEKIYCETDHTAELLREICIRKIKPAAKIELLTQEAAEKTLKEYNLPNPVIRRAVPDGSLVEIFFGACPDNVHRALMLTDRVQSSDNSEEYRQSLLELGILFGYPKCCAKKWAMDDTAKMRESYAWAHLSRRTDNPGFVHPAMNPYSGPLSDLFVPCSLKCEAALEKILAMKSIAGKILGAENIKIHDAGLENPWLVILENQGSAIELKALDEPGYRFSFSAGQTRGKLESALSPAFRSDEIIMNKNRLFLYGKGRLITDLSLRAFIWWHKELPQKEVWSRIIGLRKLSSEDRAENNIHLPGQKKKGSENPDIYESDALVLTPELKMLKKKLIKLLERSLNYKGEPVYKWKIWARSKNTLSLKISGVRDILLFAEDADATERNLFITDGIAFTIAEKKAHDDFAREIIRIIRSSEDKGE